METLLVHCLWHCLLVLRTRNNTSNELVIFPGIALKTDNKTILAIPYTRPIRANLCRDPCFCILL